ncbi:putative lipoyltransferase 2, mitochondrial [Cylas formicarius]|uniref:putative lipoyltransferase 2, mitochondrial n=1 Tax=Cylas formicarius TaxID=197179 RepID=UPI002958B6BB|nr:putative lipoyltransferase 2, mitochondrial [Cylas formicarius]
MTKRLEKIVKIWNLGKVDYAKALKIQNVVASCHGNTTSDNVLLCLEHLPVYTVGIRNLQYSHREEVWLKEKGADFYRTNRGGLITFHGPGQLVVYPILNLKCFTPSMRWYVCQIERTVINLCKKFNLEAETSPHTGVWIKDNKVCAIGVHGSRFVTTHGLAINCATDLSWFDHIVPCGIEGKGVTSLSKELNREVSTSEVLPLFLDSFCDIFQCNRVPISSTEVKCFLNKIQH